MVTLFLSGKKQYILVNLSHNDRLSIKDPLLLHFYVNDIKIRNSHILFSAYKVKTLKIIKSPDEVFKNSSNRFKLYLRLVQSKQIVFNKYLKM